MRVEIQKTDGTVESMPITEFSRWMCLLEAFEILNNKATELKLDVSDLIKPLAIDEYIKERYPAMLHDVECELKLGNI